ncbi:hypothetical protein [Pseudobutyrivibrio sp.]
MIDKYKNYQEYFNSYLGAWTFEKGDETLTISDINEEEMYNRQTNQKIKKITLRFKEKPLPMVLNKTNAATIANVLGSSTFEDWIGKRIIVGTQDVSVGGRQQPAIRVRSKIPTEEPKEKATPEQVTQLRGLIDSGAITSEENMLKKFGVSRIEDMSVKDAAAVIETKTSGI